MLTFEHPFLLLLLFLIIPLFYLRHLFPRRGGSLPFPVGIYSDRHSFSPRQPLLFAVLSFATLLFWVGLIGLFVALAGPGRSVKTKIYLSRGKDVVFVLDESPSMAAGDFSPGNRFEAAKQVIYRYIEQRENDAVGLVTFSRDAALRIPPTLDYDHCRNVVESLSLMELGDGTAIGIGLTLAALHLQDSKAREKVIVLLTDGNNNAGEISPESAAEIISQMGIRLYTVGIGTEGDVPFEFQHPETGVYIKGILKEGFDGEKLEALANLAGGRYFAADSPGALDSVIRTIDSIEVTEKRVKYDIETRPLHREVILFSFLCLVLYYLIRKGFLMEVF